MSVTVRVITQGSSVPADCFEMENPTYCGRTTNGVNIGIGKEGDQLMLPIRCPARFRVTRYSTLWENKRTVIISRDTVRYWPSQRQDKLWPRINARPRGHAGTELLARAELNYH